jgi:hypothetical protein
MIEASKMADQVVWLDTDCEVRTSIADIFDRTVFNKLTMAQDKPWSTRRKETWHNSGVVAFQNCPTDSYQKWAEEVKKNPKVGDQEVLHSLLCV